MEERSLWEIVFLDDSSEILVARGILYAREINPDILKASRLKVIEELLDLGVTIRKTERGTPEVDVPSYSTSRFNYLVKKLSALNTAEICYDKGMHNIFEMCEFLQNTYVDEKDKGDANYLIMKEIPERVNALKSINLKKTVLSDAELTALSDLEAFAMHYRMVN